MIPQLRLVPKNPDQLTPQLRTFLLAQEAAHHTPKTCTFYEYVIGSFISTLQELDVVRIGDITPSHIRQHLLNLQKRGCKDTTVHDHATGIKAWLNWLVAEGELAASPMTKVKMPKMENRILPALSPDNLQALLAACPKTPMGLRDKAMLLCLLDSGVRASEFMALRIGSIDMKTGLCKVHGKGHKERIVRFGARSRLVLTRYIATRMEPRDGDPLWITYDWKGGQANEALTHDGLRMVLRRLEKQTGIHVTPHQFRRTFCLWSLRQGMDLFSLQRLTGHADIAILRQYLALAESDAQVAHEKYGPVDNMLPRRGR
jgi:integrase/recombinase XerC